MSSFYVYLHLLEVWDHHCMTCGIVVTFGEGILHFAAFRAGFFTKSSLAREHDVSAVQDQYRWTQLVGAVIKCHTCFT